MDISQITLSQQKRPGSMINRCLEILLSVRIGDYKNRNDLYVFPDEAMYHIDKEIDKWIVDDIILTEGIYSVYIVPSNFHDLSRLVFSITGDFNCQLFGTFKSLDLEKLGLLPPGVTP